MLKGKTIVVGITGCSAGHKALDVMAQLRKQNADVYAVMTKNACHFVTPLMVQRNADHPIALDAFELPKNWDKNHKPLTEVADLMLIMPASANIIGKTACGIADDLLSTIIMSMSVPIVFATHINNKMYSSPSVQRNIRTLKEDGCRFVDNQRPDQPGSFPDGDQILSLIADILG